MSSAPFLARPLGIHIRCWGLLLILPLATVPTAAADEVEDHVVQAEQAAADLQPLCHAILVSLKEIRGELDNPDQPTEAERAAARQRLGQVRSLVETFERRAQAADEARAPAREALREAAQAGRAVDPQSDRLTAAAQQAARYQRYVEKFYGRAVDTYGAPPDDLGPAAALPGIGAQPAGGLRIQGELLGGLGQSGYKRPNVEGEATAATGPLDESATDMQFRVQAKTRLPAGTNLSAHISREQRVERREITLTEIGAGADHRFPFGLRLEGGVSRQGYDEELNDRAGYGEMRLHVGGRLQSGRNRFGARIERRSRAYNDDEDYDPSQRLDYDVTVLRLDGQLRPGSSVIDAALTQTKRSAENEAAEHTLLGATFDWLNRPGGSGVEFEAQRLTRPLTGATGQDDDEWEELRLKLRLPFARQTPRSSRRLAPEVLYYSFPDLEDADYAEAGLALESRPRGGERIGSRHSRVFYRYHQNEDAFDYVSLSHRALSRPIGRGFFSRLGVTAKFFVGQADYDSLDDVGASPTSAEVYVALGAITQAFQTTRAPHALDVHWRGGWTIRKARSLVRSISFGPALGHALYADTERKRLQDMANDLVEKLPESQRVDDPLGDTEFLLRNPINRGRAGAHVAVDLTGPSGWTGRLAAQYDAEVLYNADPVQTLTAIDVSGSARYPIRPNLHLEGNLNVHSSKVGDGDSPNDYTRTEVRVMIRYLFDVSTRRSTSPGRSQS